jgi:hypothetical protein
MLFEFSTDAAINAYDTKTFNLTDE